MMTCTQSYKEMQIKQYIPKGWKFESVHKVCDDSVNSYRRSRWHAFFRMATEPFKEYCITLLSIQGELIHAYDIPNILERALKEDCVDQI